MNPSLADPALNSTLSPALHPLLTRLVTETGAAVLDPSTFDGWAQQPGAAMVVNEQGEVAGSVSGGCVEGAVVGEALAILRGEALPRVVTFGYSDDDAFAVGLTCGGIIRLFIEPLDW